MGALSEQNRALVQRQVDIDPTSAWSDVGSHSLLEILLNKARAEAAATVERERDNAIAYRDRYKRQWAACALAAEAQVEALKKSLRDIAFLRPGGPTRNKLAMQMERIAMDALDAVFQSATVKAEESSEQPDGAPYGIARIWAKALSDIVLDYRVNHTSKWARDTASIALSAASVSLLERLSLPTPASEQAEGDA